MITIQLPSGEQATVSEGVWTVQENAEFTRLFNTPAMQPTLDGTYAPTEDARKAQHILRVWGGVWVSSDEPAPEPGVVY